MLIAGGGIAGLATALALTRYGISSQILERRAAFAEAGAGIQIGPNGTRVLDFLGISDLLRPHVSVPNAIEVNDGRGEGRQLAELPLGDWIQARHGSPYWVVRREDLHAALQARVAGKPLITLTMGAAASDINVAPNQVEVVAAGQRWIADALVGADGVWSAARGLIGGDIRPRPIAKSASRTTLPMADVPSVFRRQVVGVWMQPGAHVVHYPVCAGKALAVVVIAPDAVGSQDWSRPTSSQRVSASTQQFPSAIRELVAAATQWHQAPMFEALTLPTYCSGPIALVGDAAHPILPFLAQGGVMALEDAVVLARAVAATPDMAAAFRAYSDVRRPRTHRVAAASERNGMIYHLKGTAAVARNSVLRMASGDSIMGRYDWLYGTRL